MLLVSVQSQIASMLLRKRNSPTAHGPMLKKMKKKKSGSLRHLKEIPKKQYRLSIINSPSQPIPSSHQMMQQTSFSLSQITMGYHPGTVKYICSTKVSPSISPMKSS